MESRELQGGIARLHYLHGMTHHEIGNQLGLSRVKVTRVLAEARRTGVVEIRIHSETAPFGELETRLVEALGLQQAWVAPSLPSAERTGASVGMAGAECLDTLTATVRTIAVGLSSNVAAIVPHLQQRDPVPDLGFVPLAGSWGGPSRGMSPHELVLRFGTAFGADTYHLPAPILASTPAAAREFKADPGVQQTLGIAERAELLIAGVGALEARSGMLVDSLDAGEREELVRRGAVGDISARFFDGDGAAVTCAVDERVVGMTLATLTAIPQRVAVCFGEHKIRALEAALRAGLMNMVVTDVDTAEALLATREGN